MGCLSETAKRNYSQQTTNFQCDNNIQIAKKKQTTKTVGSEVEKIEKIQTFESLSSVTANNFLSSTTEIAADNFQTIDNDSIELQTNCQQSYQLSLFCLNRTNCIDQNCCTNSIILTGSNNLRNNLYLQQRTNQNAINQELSQEATIATIQSTDDDGDGNGAGIECSPFAGHNITKRLLSAACNRLINYFSNYNNSKQNSSSNLSNKRTALQQHQHCFHRNHQMHQRLQQSDHHHHHHRHHHRHHHQHHHHLCHQQRLEKNSSHRRIHLGRNLLQQQQQQPHLTPPEHYTIHNPLRHSFNFSAASSVLLVLCYLATATVAAVSDHPIFDESSSDKEILDHLLQKSRYDKRLLPPVNDEDFCCGLSSPDMAKNQTSMRPHNRGTLTVNVNVLLLSLASPDESSLKYEVEFLLNQQWNDPRLQYGNKSQYEYLNALHHHDNIWTPDTYFIMHGDFKDPIIPMHFALRIYRNGTITYAMRRHLILSCQGSLHIFPFDDPKCSFSMESISYEFPQIKYVWKNDEDTLRKSPSLTTLNAYLIQNATVLCSVKSWRGNYSCLKVDLIFTRDRAFYFTTVFIPGIILVTSSFITFWLEWNAVPARSMIGNYSCLKVELMFTRDRAFYFTTVFIPGIILVTSSFITFWLEWNAVPARVMIGVTTMLNFFTTSNGFRSTLPVVSNLTAMNVWDGVCMCFIYASLLEFVCVNYVGRKRPLHNVVYRPGENPVTQRLPAVLSRIGVILASPLEIIEREFHAAVSSEKAQLQQASGSLPRRFGGSLYGRRSGFSGPSGMSTPTSSVDHHCEYHQHHHHHHPSQLHHRTQQQQEQIYIEPVYAETVVVEPTTTTTMTSNGIIDHSTNLGNNFSIETFANETIVQVTGPYMRQSRSMSTNTPPLISASGKTKVDIHCDDMAASDMEMTERQIPIKPPRRKSSRSTTPSGINETTDATAAPGTMNCNADDIAANNTGEKKRGDSSGPNEIVACTNCGGGSSPCTHSANNGCATETCFVQVRKKEPPHPIRVAKTIDVIARITFPTAYAIFLIFFFVHYKGFS